MTDRTQEKPTKGRVRWTDKRRVPEEGLERFEDYLQTYSRNRNHPVKILFSFYKGTQAKLLKACAYLVLQRSPVWVIPIVTSNIINAATDRSANAVEIILLNLLVALVFIVQNAGTNYLATKEYAGVNRGIEGSLRNAMVRKLQQLSIMFHKEVQSGRLQSKIMRDVENVTELLNQVFRTLFFFALDISVVVAITLHKSPVVFLFFVVVVPFAVLTMRAFRRPITEKNREDIAISVTMIPERIAPRQVELKLPEETMRALASNSGSSMVMGDSDAAQAWEAGQPYVTMLRDTFREVALGNVPQGYTLRSVSRKDQLPRCIQDGLSINFKDGQVLEGHNINVYVGTIENVSDEAIEFIEQECGDWNTAAVTSYPLKVLRPKQVTEVYVAVKREQERPSGTVRKPLVKREFR